MNVRPALTSRIFLMVLFIGGCGATAGSSVAPVGTGATGSTPGATAAAAASPAAPSGIPTNAPRSVEPSIPSSCLPLPHKAPELEAQLPDVIADRKLSKESYDGTLIVLCINGGDSGDVADFAALLAEEGLTLDDIAVAVAGRADIHRDPPYFVSAYQIAGHRGSEWPSTTGLDHPDLAAFVLNIVGGKRVLVGDSASMDQDDHQRGRPYVWDSTTVHYVVLTDDPEWAEEALRALS